MEKTAVAKRVMPAGGLKGEVRPPGDKSISHRAVFFGSIAEGDTAIENILEGDDNLATIDAFRAMGVGFTREDSTLVVSGRGMRGLCEPDDVIDARNSGTTARLLTGLLSAQGFFSVITGDASLRRRPMKRVVEPLSMMGAEIRGRKDATLLPLAITGEPLTGIHYRTPVASAQLKSAILIAGLYADGETTVTEPMKSRDHTERMLGHFGVRLSIRDRSVTVKKTASLKAARIRVPGDFSSAAFLIVAGLITPESDLLVRDTGLNPTRTGLLKILGRMGAAVDIVKEKNFSGEPAGDISVRSSHLKGVHVTGPELLPAIDEFPILCIAAAMARGTTIIEGAAELRVKESDRIAAMARALTMLGVHSEEREDGIIIEGKGGGLLKGGRFDPAGDHRVAMSMAVAALVTDTGIEIDGAGSVDVSFPGFFSSLDRLAVR